MKYDVTIVGAGIVGLSVGYNLIKERPDLSIAIIDKENEVAKHQTGRNSGVIHSGIYYKPGSSKAINCSKGYQLMLDFCKEHNIKHDICGKLIVACEEQEIGKLKEIYQRGQSNGLQGLKLVDAKELRKIEPYVNGVMGIHVPQAGIVDYKEVANRLYSLLVDSGVEFYLGEQVTTISKSKKGTFISTKESVIESKVLVNCAGLYSDKIARMDGVKLNAKIIPFRGEYYLLKENKKHLVSNLIYPVPNPAFPFLGVHFTRRISGEVDAGPNAVLAFSREGYKKKNINIGEVLESLFYRGFAKVALKYYKVGMYEVYRSFSKKAFTRALQKLVPSVKEADLISGTSGVRAQLCHSNGKLEDDFLIKYTDNGVHVINAPSPAATSSLQIGKDVCQAVLPLVR